jgi:hypothetical protein
MTTTMKTIEASGQLETRRYSQERAVAAETALLALANGPVLHAALVAQAKGLSYYEDRVALARRTQRCNVELARLDAGRYERKHADKMFRIARPGLSSRLRALGRPERLARARAAYRAQCDAHECVLQAERLALATEWATAMDPRDRAAAQGHCIFAWAEAVLLGHRLLSHGGELEQIKDLWMVDFRAY